MLADADLKPISLNWAPVLQDSYKEESIRNWLEEFKRKITETLEVGIPMMTMAYGRLSDDMDLREQRRICTDAYRRLAEYALTRGMNMLLELPHLYLVHNDCASTYELLNDLDLPNVGVLLDSSHWGVIGYDVENHLEKLATRLWHVHLRDSSPIRDEKRDRTFTRPAIYGKNPYNLTLTPGLGVVDFARLGSALDGVGYRRDVTTELEYFDMHLDEIERQYDAGLSHLLESGWDLPDGVVYDRNPPSERGAT